jgi:4-amino-4-deoxy-L-arabinose transferase-like glycosyltransferase
MNNLASLFFYCAIFLLLISLVLFVSGKSKVSLLFLILGTIAIGVFGALLDPFLNLWDERFHALVAKNLLNHPLMPTLYDDPVVPFQYDRWDRFHIWLHKQPLFLWQISLCFKLFGVNEFVLRIPGIVQEALIVVLIFRIGKLIIKERVGYFSAFLFATSSFVIELVAGRQSLEHNDVAFLFYITCSIWSWVEYLHSKNRYWIIFIGIFSGCAVLCKWLVGLLVYFIWFSYAAFCKPINLKQIKEFLIAVIITTIVVLPWQILILNWYPSEAIQAYKYSSMHLYKVIEGHGGDYWFYLDSFSTLYGKLAPWVILPGLFLLRKKMRDIKLFQILFVLTPIFIYLFFTISKTKMVGYPFVIAPILYFGLGAILDSILCKAERGNISKVLTRIVFIILVALIGWYNIDFQNLKKGHSLNDNGNQFSQMMVKNRDIFKSLKATLPANSVIFNVKGRHYIECMFYSGFPSYNFIPSIEQYNRIKSANRRVAIFVDDVRTLPEWLSNDKTLLVLNPSIRGYD